MQDSYKQIQNENYQLRDYIINLQSRLIESQGDDAVPPPPAVFVHPAPPLMLVDTSTPPQQPQQLQTLSPQAVSVATMPAANMGGDLVGQKRAHDDEAFLQSIAQAAGTSGGQYIQQQQPLQVGPRKSTSPAAKRVKGEKEIVVAGTLPVVVGQGQKIGDAGGVLGVDGVNGV